MNIQIASPAVIIAGRPYGLEDAVHASVILAEASAGHDAAADRIASQAGIGNLTNEQMETLCAAFGVELVTLAELKEG